MTALRTFAQQVHSARSSLALGADLCVAPTNLPSATAAEGLLRGDPGTLLPVIGSMLARAGLIGIGIFLAGERDVGKLAKYSLAGAAGIETFVLGYVAINRDRTKDPPQAVFQKAT